jgi:peptidyl-tRNA hydrolase
MRRWRPEISTAHTRTEQADPWVMYLVVAKTAAGSRQALLTDGARAALAIEQQLAEDQAYRPAFDSWWEESFRKVSLRAKPSQWQAIQELPGASFGQVRALVPSKRSARDPILAKLQTLNEQTTIAVTDQPEPAQRLSYYLLDTIGLGKQLAQIAHAGLKLAVEHHLDLADLIATPTAVILTNAAELERQYQATGLISEIRDAGLTEVEPNTRTVVARLTKP